MNDWHKYLALPPEIAAYISTLEQSLPHIYGHIEGIASQNQVRVLNAFQELKVSEDDFNSTTGYGYHDAGREKTENLYALLFGGEKALVRPQLVSGTHAISCCLFGLLRPGDRVLSLSGPPYDTLHQVIGYKGKGDTGSLQDYQIDFTWEDVINPVKDRDAGPIKAILEKYQDDTSLKMAYIQRSRGYSLERPSLTVKDLEFLFQIVEEALPGRIIFVDNCYGEFVEEKEPLQVGAHLIAGSLIKNPGGGLAPSGGYVVGRGDLVDLAAGRVTAPGLGASLGPTLGTSRSLLQGLFLAPHFVGEALKSVVFAAALFSELGFAISPKSYEERGDIVQAILLKSPERVEKFCRAIQANSPVDSHVTPVPGHVPGYERKVIMAAGTFVQGSSLELSADAPLAQPYAVYLQGGLVYAHSRAAIAAAAAAVLR